MITINYRDGRPIYEQVKEQLRLLVVSGGLHTGDKLPSVRELAGSLTINPNTIQRAYRELESEGYIVSVPGKGSFVSRMEEENQKRQTELFEALRQTVKELRWLGIPETEILERMKGAFSDGEN